MASGPHIDNVILEKTMGIIGPINHKNDCGVCGKELVYRTEQYPATCYYCGRSAETNAACADGHYVCDACHGLKGKDIIETFCSTTDMTDPLAMALIIMKNPEIKMHGPEHHFLVPAVLLSAYCNVKGIGADEKRTKIEKARQRSDNILGGFCGFYGDCGAAVGTGIFLSVLTGATPLSTEDWRLGNLITAKSLLSIAEHGGPRCCKRNSFLAILEAVRFIEAQFGVSLQIGGPPQCEFNDLNKECLTVDCPFYS
jgi:hypothetical protein